MEHAAEPQPLLLKGLERLLAWIFLAALGLNLLNAVLRATSNNSLLWADEAQQFALVWLAFLGGVLATAQGRQLRMDLLRDRLPTGAQVVIAWLEALLLPLFSGFALWQSVRYLSRILALDARSDMAGIPMWLPHAAVTLGFGLMLGVEMLRLLRRVRGVSA
jgi:TRAP-type C4-dicarboxylate transport system permease small subunit